MPDAPTNCKSDLETAYAVSNLAHLLFVSRGKDGNLSILNGAPLQKLLLPLQDGDGRSAEDQDRFLDGASGRDADQSLSSAARQDDDARSGSAVPKHFREGLLLVRPDHGRWLEVDLEVGIDRVVPEVVLFQHGVLEYHGLPLDVFDFARLDFERVHVVVVVNFVLCAPKSP
jgi:hypothetical protein